VLDSVSATPLLPLAATYIKQRLQRPALRGDFKVTYLPSQP